MRKMRDRQSEKGVRMRGEGGGEKEQERQEKRGRALTSDRADRNRASIDAFFFNERQWGVERLAHLQYRRMQVQEWVPVRRKQNFSLLFSSPPPHATQPAPVLASAYAPPLASV